ncbi:hypothetical protein Angca_008987 [Angiostrongylus cantonensis]|nr:hypothetical protein Angca_008987 [Angiostrongylus cantonensis]
MAPGYYGNRRRSRSRTRNRNAWTRMPQRTSLPCAQGRPNSGSEPGNSSCELCNAPSFATRIASRESHDAVVFGPQNRPRPRSKSVNRARFRKPLLLKNSKEAVRFPWIPSSAQKQRPNVPTQTDITGSSSDPEPMDSPTLSRVSSTLSSVSVADLFPFDSEIFTDTSPNDVNKVNNSVEKEDSNEKKNGTDGVVALGNLNAVAICASPGMITKPPSKAALDNSDASKSLNARIPPVPPSELSETIKKLRAMAGLAKKPPKDASMFKRTDLDDNAVVASATGATRLQDDKKPLQRTHLAQSATSAVSTGTSTGIASVKSSPFAPKSSSLHVTSPPWSIENATKCSPLAIAAHNLKFCCQLAHGSPTAIISNFTSIDELFQSIADCFNISADDIIFCTVNTFKIDMDKLFAGSLGYADMLFAHIKGQAIEVELTKTEGMFGITVSDNGRCRSFIKRLKENSIVSRARPALAVGQLIECIDGVNVTGMRHFEVVRILRNMPIGKTFILRVVSPKQSGFQQIASRSTASRKKNVNDGMQTLRFKATGGVVIEEGVVDKEMIGRLNEILDSYLGVQDDQMAQSLWELALSCKTLPDMSKAVKESELSVFDFPEELVFDMWGVVGDSRRTRDNQAKPKPKEKQNLLRRDEKLAPTPLFY